MVQVVAVQDQKLLVQQQQEELTLVAVVAVVEHAVPVVDQVVRVVKE